MDADSDMSSFGHPPDPWSAKLKARLSGQESLTIGRLGEAADRLRRTVELFAHNELGTEIELVTANINCNLGDGIVRANAPTGKDPWLEALHASSSPPSKPVPLL
jgi:hypothetical protein